MVVVDVVVIIQRKKVAKWRLVQMMKRKNVAAVADHVRRHHPYSSWCLLLWVEKNITIKEDVVVIIVRKKKKEKWPDAQNSPRCY